MILRYVYSPDINEFFLININYLPYNLIIQLREELENLKNGNYLFESKSKLYLIFFDDD